MNMQSMSEQRFAELAGSYGAAIARWPASEREAAGALLRHSAQARAVLDDARELDAAFAQVPAPDAPSADLRRRLLAAAPGVPEPGLADLLRALWREIGGARRAGPMLAASLALGVVLTPLAAPLPVDEDETMVQMALSDADYEEWVP
jgi:anti-sigma-K factor RskA